MKLVKNFIHQDIPKEIEIIIDSIINNFLNEMKLCYEGTGDNEIFQYNERAFIGFLNNAIIRGNNKIITIQEYSIKNHKTKKYGRPDLLYFDNESTQNICILFEAKQNHTNEKKDKKWDKNKTDKYLQETLLQVKKYYEYPDEKKFYLNKKLYLCAIVFDSVLIESTVSDYIKKNDFEINNYFSYTIFEEMISNKILNIYGKVENIKN